MPGHILDQISCPEQAGVLIFHCPNIDVCLYAVYQKWPLIASCPIKTGALQGRFLYQASEKEKNLLRKVMISCYYELFIYL